MRKFNSAYIAIALLFSFTAAYPAVNESDPDTSILRIKSGKSGDLTSLKLCERFCISGRWRDLQLESAKGVKTSRDNYLKKEFVFYNIKALYNLERFDEALKVINRIKSTRHSAELGLIKNSIELQTSGNIKRAVCQIQSGIGSYTSLNPSALYIFAEENENIENYSAAYSAYTDIIKLYPRSPEALLAREKIPSLKQYNPAYNPDYLKKPKDESFSIDIKPEREEVASDDSDGFYYTVAVTSFYNLKKAKAIKDTLSSDFEPVFIMKDRRDFVIYIGRTKSRDEAQEIKIRIAEEFGLKGDITSIKSSSNDDYIYRK